MPCTPGGGGAPTTARPYHCWTRRPVVEVISDCDQAGLQGAKGREDRPRGPASRWFLVRPISAPRAYVGGTLNSTYRKAHRRVLWSKNCSRKPFSLAQRSQSGPGFIVHFSR